MLPIQALKFERLFDKVSGLVITQESYDSFLKGLLRMQVKYKETALAHRAFVACRRAREEGRVTVVNPDSSAG